MPTPIQQVVDYFLELKDPEEEGEEPPFKRWVRDAKILLEYCDGDIEKAKSYIDRLHKHYEFKNVTWNLSTVIKKLIELDAGLIP
jgi:hypothetical protein